MSEAHQGAGQHGIEDSEHERTQGVETASLAVRGAGYGLGTALLAEYGSGRGHEALEFVEPVLDEDDL